MPSLANFKVRRDETHFSYRHVLRVIIVHPVPLALYSNSNYTYIILVLVRMSEEIRIWDEVFKNYCRGVLGESSDFVQVGGNSCLILPEAMQSYAVQNPTLCLNSTFQPLGNNNSRCLLYLIINHQLFELITLVSQHLHDGWQNSRNFNFHQSVSKRWASASVHQSLRIYATIIMIVPNGVLHKMS